MVEQTIHLISQEAEEKRKRLSLIILYKSMLPAGHQWLMPVILATWEAKWF
jgi:hypothetical protein